MLLDVIKQDLGETSLAVERLYALLHTRRKILSADHFVNGSAAPRTCAEEDLKQLIATFTDGLPQSSAPVLAPVVDVEMAASTPKKKLSRLMERRETRGKAAAGGDDGNRWTGPRGAGPLVSVNERFVLIGR